MKKKDIQINNLIKFDLSPIKKLIKISNILDC